MLGALLRCRGGLADRCAELIKFVLGIVQLAIDDLQTHDDERMWTPAAAATPSGTLMAGSRNVLRMPSAFTRRIRCCLSNRSTADTRSRAAFAGEGALSHSSRNQVAVRSSLSFSIWGNTARAVGGGDCSAEPAPLLQGATTRGARLDGSQQSASAEHKLDELCTAIGETATASEERAEHRDVAILRSLPGIGRINLATLLSEASGPLSRR